MEPLPPPTAPAAVVLALFVVDTKTEGFKKGKKLKKMGMKAQDTAELFFEDLRVPASSMLGTRDYPRLPEITRDHPARRRACERHLLTARARREQAPRTRVSTA